MGIISDAVKTAVGGAGAAGGGAAADEERRRRRADGEAVPPGRSGGMAPPVWSTSTGSGTNTGTQAETQTQAKSCKRCPPDCGQIVHPNHSMNDAPSQYQTRITGFPPGEEWRYMGVDFDGFNSGECLLLEAKGNYDQFLDSAPGKPPTPKFFFRGFTRMEVQIASHSEVVIASRPSRCHWHFQTPLAYELMSPLIWRHSPLLQPYYTP